MNDSNHFDVIIIGSGIGGLTAAGLLAKAGKKVLVLEQHDRAGGYAHGFKRKKYTFDAGVHLTSGCGLQGFSGGQIIRKVLQAVNMYDSVQFVKVNPFSFVSVSGVTTELPSSIDCFINELSQQFPAESQGLHDLMTLCLQLAEQVATAEDMLAASKQNQSSPELNLLLQYRQSTLADVWADYIKSPELRAIFAALWPYLGLPPSKISFIYWASMLIGYIEDGAYYCLGGFQVFANALVEGLTQAGGEIRFKSPVQKIRIENNQAQGVQLKSGEIINAKTLISNADMRHTVQGLVGEQYFPKRYLSRLNRMQASLSIFVVYIATDLDLLHLGVHHESFYYDQLDHEINYQNSRQGELSWLSITVPTLVDDSLAPKGEHLVMLTTLADFNSTQNWAEEKQAFIDKMLDFADKKIPSLKQHILFIEAGSPATMQRYTSNYEGAAYGWDVTPAQVGANRAANQSPIAGLYFTGHWTTPGGGIYGVSYSGVQTAQKILGLAQKKDLWAACTEYSDNK